MRQKTAAPYVAALINLIFLPFGYLYAGAWRLTLGILLAILMVGGGAYYLSIASPPGIYSFTWPIYNVARIILAVATATHVFVLARRHTYVLGAWKRLGGVTVAIIAFGVVVILIRGFMPDPVYDVKSGAMLPNLVRGDVLAFHGARFLCGSVRPKAGDVVVFKRPGRPLRYLERVIATPGDVLAFQGDVPVVNGRAASEQPIGKAVAGVPPEMVRETLPSGASYRVMHVPQPGSLPYAGAKVGPDEWYVLGDNRDDAIDSRQYGPIPTSAICGIAYEYVMAHDARLVSRKP